eukprot:363066-Chlamydomonas_euryale.AAC.6
MEHRSGCRLLNMHVPASNCPPPRKSLFLFGICCCDSIRHRCCGRAVARYASALRIHPLSGARTSASSMPVSTE